MPQFGKGLEALIPKKQQSILGTEYKKEAVFSIEIEKIKPNPYQPRRDFDEANLKALADSIRAHGILQPLVVSRVEDSNTGKVEYQLIAGERRWRAAKMANFSRVPVIIREPNDKQKLELSLIENVQREDLNPLERAEAFKRLHEEFGLSHKDIAKLTGKSREAVTNTVRLLALPEEIKLALSEEKITEGHARAILMARTPEHQKEVFAQVVRENLNVREAESAVHKLAVWRPIKRTKEFLEEFRGFEKKLKSILGIPNLKFKMEAGQPKLVIPFQSRQEVENLLKRFGG